MRWRKLILDNLWWKLLAFALAVMIWSGAQGLDSRSIQTPLHPVARRVFHEVPVLFLSPPEAAQPMLFDPDSVRVTVGGETPLLQRLTLGDVLAFVQVDQGAEPSPHRATSRVEIRLPPGFTALQVTPARVTLTPAPLAHPATPLNPAPTPAPALAPARVAPPSTNPAPIPTILPPPPLTPTPLPESP